MRKLCQTFTYKWYVLFILSTYLLVGCFPIASTIKHQYKLTTYSKQKIRRNNLGKRTIFVNLPRATSGLATNEMLYCIKPFEINSYTHNSWVDTPAQMLLPLMIQSIQESGCFRAVASNLGSVQTDFRIDTDFITLQQNFITKPSVVNFKAEVTLTNIGADQVIASRLFNYSIPCRADTPYGGVIAANFATRYFTRDLTNFIIRSLRSKSS